ncbi:MAG TPA: hypothetical protein VE441_11610 [Mycobacterium sp.]|nr:hypothetical protein [Mycobacterium sp.]
MTATPRRRRDESDLVLLELVRLSSIKSWNRQHAARALLAKQHTAGALRLARARVQRARVHAPSRIADRAAATLGTALTVHDQRQPSGRHP